MTALTGSANIHIVDRLNGVVGNTDPLRQQLQSLFSLLTRVSREIEEAREQRVRSVDITDGTIRVSLERKTREKLPVLIKVSYFPYWRRIDSSEPVYLVTPSFMLTYTRSDLALDFTADRFVWLGVSISIITAAGLALACQWRHRSRGQLSRVGKSATVTAGGERERNR